MIKQQPWLLIILFLIITPLMLTPFVHGNDGAGYYSIARSWIIDHDNDLKNEHDHYEEQFNVNSIKEDPVTGVWYSQYPIGTPLLWTPFILAGHTIALATEYATDGYSFPYVFMMALSSALMVLAGLVTTYHFLHRFFSKKVALFSIITFWMSSNLIYYTYLEGSLSHAASFFTVTLFLYAWHSWKDLSGKHWIILGLLGALIISVRYQNGLFLTIPFFFILKNKNWQHLLPFALGGVAGMIPQAINLFHQHKSLFSASTSYQYGFSFTQALWNWWNVLFSTNHGLFLWTPIALVAVIGLVYGLRRSRYAWLVIALSIPLVLELFFVAGLRDWHGAQSFSHRMFINCSFIFIFGLAFLYDWAERRQKLFYALGVGLILIGWNFNLMFQYGLRLIPAEGPIDFANVLQNTFELPKRMWGVLRSFITNRGSFTP